MVQLLGHALDRDYLLELPDEEYEDLLNRAQTARAELTRDGDNAAVSQQVAQ